MNVADWLRTLGLERYEAAFRENDVDIELLPTLTADDLKELGVTSLGHRRRLLQAIAKLRDDDAASLQAVSSTSDHRASTSAGERRQLTVMFCDLVGSTPLPRPNALSPDHPTRGISTSPEPAPLTKSPEIRLSPKSLGAISRTLWLR